MDERVENFLRNWVDANIEHPAEPVADGEKALEHRFLADAVAAGLTLDQVNGRWVEVEAEIAAALDEAGSNP